MRPWQAILLVLVLAFFAISSGWHVLYLLTYVLLTLLILSWLWARYSLRKMIFRRTASSGRVQVGEIFEERRCLIMSACCRSCGCRSLMAQRCLVIAPDTSPAWAGANVPRGARARSANSAGASNLAPSPRPAAIPLACSSGAFFLPSRRICWSCRVSIRSATLCCLRAAYREEDAVRAALCIPPLMQPRSVNI